MDKKEKYMNAIIAVPTSGQGGLDAPCSPHFGRCECFTVIEVENGEPKEVVVAFNPPHGQGDCLGPVDLLVSKSVNALIVRGIGMRPLVGFRNAGIEVYYMEKEGTARDAALAFAKGELEPLPDDFSCQGRGMWR